MIKYVFVLESLVHRCCNTRYINFLEQIRGVLLPTAHKLLKSRLEFLLLLDINLELWNFCIDVVQIILFLVHFTSQTIGFILNLRQELLWLLEFLQNDTLIKIGIVFNFRIIAWWLSEGVVLAQLFILNAFHFFNYRLLFFESLLELLFLFKHVVVKFLIHGLHSL